MTPLADISVNVGHASSDGGATWHVTWVSVNNSAHGIQLFEAMRLRRYDEETFRLWSMEHRQFQELTPQLVALALADAKAGPGAAEAVLGKLRSLGVFGKEST